MCQRTSAARLWRTIPKPGALSQRLQMQTDSACFVILQRIDSARESLPAGARPHGFGPHGWYSRQKSGLQRPRTLQMVRRDCLTSMHVDRSLCLLTAAFLRSCSNQHRRPKRAWASNAQFNPKGMYLIGVCCHYACAILSLECCDCHGLVCREHPRAVALGGCRSSPGYHRRTLRFAWKAAYACPLAQVPATRGYCESG